MYKLKAAQKSQLELECVVAQQLEARACVSTLSGSTLHTRATSEPRIGGKFGNNHLDDRRFTSGHYVACMICGLWKHYSILYGYRRTKRSGMVTYVELFMPMVVVKLA